MPSEKMPGRCLELGVIRAQGFDYLFDLVEGESFPPL